MATNIIKYKLNKNRSKVSENTNTFINVPLLNESRILPSGELNRIISIDDVFNQERNKSKRFRLVSTIRPIFSNVLMNPVSVTPTTQRPNSFGDTNNQYSNNNSYGLDIFEDRLFVNNALLNVEEFTREESLSRYLKEINGWFGFFNPDVTLSGNLCDFIFLEPKKSRFELDSNLENKNWYITVTYPFDSDNNHHLVKGGLLVTSIRPRNLGNRVLTSIGVAVPHNLSLNNSVRLIDTPSPLLEGDFNVIALGFEDGAYKETFFTIDLEYDLISNITNINARMKRLYFGNEVEYYVRKFKKINGYETNEPLTKEDSECYPLSFSNTIYSDQIYQNIFNQDITTEGLKDNLGRPLSEIYLTIIRNKIKGGFTKIISGFELDNFPGNTNTSSNDGKKVSNIRKMHTSTSPNVNFETHTPLENNIKIDNNWWYGDICEYSKLEQQETILIDITHRFNMVLREITSPPFGPRNEGYLYKPHHKIKINNFSNFISQGDNSIDIIPEYATEIDGIFIWRDILPLGENDGQDETLDYPFVNGCHNIYQDISFKTYRQDPFGEYGLLYLTNFPRDIIGSSITDKFTLKQITDEC